MGVFRIAPIREDELDALATLCLEHAEYEGAPFAAGDGLDGRRARWHAALFSAAPTLHCWLATRDDGGVCGFMTVTVDFATWSAEPFAHMDCLFVREVYRGHGLGRALLAELRAFCARGGYRSAEWQTPVDNASGIGFYERIGARSRAKLRFVYELGEPAGWRASA
jgi:ribosomal protein S18 acetylase RimI-like enzyme